MLHEDLLAGIGFSKEDLADCHRYDALLGELVAPHARAFMRENVPFEEAKERARAAAGELAPPFSVDLIFLLYAALYLREDYRAAGVSEAVFFDTVRDLKYKAAECRRVKGVFGNFVAFWYEGFYRMTRFALGRLQYDIRPHKGKAVTIGEHTVREGDFELNCHIPSAGPLTSETVLDSYRRAYAFFTDKRGAGPLPIYCNSWLLYPSYQGGVFPKDSNIYRFAADYTPLGTEEYEGVFHTAWRIFGVGYEGDTARLPRETGLQRRFIDYIEAGGSFGSGMGLLLFDGERILH